MFEVWPPTASDLCARTRACARDGVRPGPGRAGPVWRSSVLALAVPALAMLALAPRGVSGQVCSPDPVASVAQLRAAVVDGSCTTVDLAPGTYLLTTSGSGPLVPVGTKIIRNAGGGTVTIDAGGASRVFDINAGTRVTLDGLEITGGVTTGGGDGAGIDTDGDSTVVRNSAVFGNVSNDDGGGLFQRAGSQLFIENSTFADNRARDRGAGLTVRVNSVLTHVTVVGNVSDDNDQGAGIDRVGGGSTDPVLTNVLVADNVGANQIRGSAWVFQGANLVEGCTTCAPGTITLDPLAQPLANNGGPTRTIALGAGSPAIDAASNVLATDQRGVARPQGPGSDIGAYEAPFSGVVQGVAVTPDGLATPVQRSVGGGYTRDFVVENTGDQAEDIALVATLGPTAATSFLSVTGLASGGTTSTDSTLTLPALASGASAIVTATYAVTPSTVGAVDTLVLTATLTSNAGVSDAGRAEVEYVCGTGTATVSTLAELRAAVADGCISTIRLIPGTYDLSSDGGGPIDPPRDLDFENAGGGEVRLDGGGAVRVMEVASGRAVSLDGLTVQNGFSPVDGGGIENQGQLTILNGLVTANAAGDDGAGIVNFGGGSMVIRNTTFSGNLAGDDGGAFQADGGAIELTHVTIVGNRAGTAGDETGGAFKLTAGATVALSNSILSDNFQGGGTLVDDAGGTVVSNGGNLVEIAGCGFCVAGDVVNQDPGLSPLANNGGNTRTHALLAGSPAIDAAQPGQALPTDQRGVPRTEGTAPDIGAFERFQTLDVRVTPDGGTILRTDGTYAVDFTVANLSPSAQNVDLFGLVAGPVAGAPFTTFLSITGGGATGQNPSVITSVPGNDSVTFQVNYQVGAGTPGQIDTLRVQGRLSANASVVDFGQVEVEYFCDGTGSATVSDLAGLRAAAGNICVAAIGITPGTYDLSSDGNGEILVDRDLTIFNTGSAPAVLDAGGTTRVMAVAGAALDLTGVILANGNAAAPLRGGGLFVDGASTAVVRRGAILGNTTGNDGGGAAVAAGGFLRLENVTIAGNSATDRGAGLDLEGTAELVHVTIAENASGGIAGGINVRGGSTLLLNSIVADNTQSGGPQVVVAGGSLTSNGGNVVEGGYPAAVSGDLATDPLLLPRALNGGASENYALDVGSPAIDAAVPSDALAVDQRGIGRPQGAAADRGAHEVIATAAGVLVARDTAAVGRLPSNGVGYVETFVVENTGGGPATYDLLAGALATAVTLDSIRGPGFTTGARPDSARSAPVPAGSSVTASVHYTVGAAALGTVDAIALTATDAATSSVTDSDTTAVTVVRPDLAITKVASVLGDTLPGAVVQFDLTVSNSGTQGADSVRVVDELPPQIAFQIGSTAETLPGALGATVDFAPASGVFGYTPTSGGCGAIAGYDACVRFIRWTLTDTLPAALGSNQGQFTFETIIR
jgi:uncharacterized repeat protein (TIGR01451 family)